jgi:hypothetical protein
MEQQIAEITEENNFIIQYLVQQNIIFDQIVVEPHFLTPEELLKQSMTLNTYLKHIYRKQIVIQNSMREETSA